MRQDLLDCLIVGTGFSGLGMAIQLKRSGKDNFVVLEKAREVGGTWRENDYPGCACDVPSHLYSFSFEPNPHWTRAFAPQREILEYLKGCADRYGLRPHLRFGQEIQDARFDERSGTWNVTTRSGDSYRARHVVLGVGALHHPLIPELPGLERFKGSTFHSAKWDHSVSLEGKRVAVVGTGASSIQFVPQIQPEVAKLTLFQRTPPWILPKPDRAITSAERAIFRTVPFVQRLFRYGLYWTFESRGLGFTVDARLMKLVARLAQRHIRKQIADPVLREKVTPQYLPGCKRILISNDYYPALAQPNVDVMTHSVREVTEEGVVTDDGTVHPADVIIFGTGFRVGELLSKVNVEGLRGRNLKNAWGSGIEAYRGTTVSGFPNLYVLMGPNTGLGHNSMVFMIEAQIQLVLSQMEELERQGGSYADVLPAAQQA
ncbi:MAG: flavin-containing monooxygenase, partial [Myxococcaceae bacterium]